MSPRRPMAVSNDNRANMSRHSRYDANLDSPLHCKSAQAHSPPRVFIKPRVENSSDKFERRASFAALSAPQQRNARPSLPTATKSAYALPRRSSSFHRTANNSMNAPTTRLPRSSTSVRPMGAKQATALEAGRDAGLFIQDPTKRNDKTEVKNARRVSSPKNKENTPSMHSSASPGRTAEPKRAFTRKQSPLVPNNRRASQHSPSKVFLLPKVEEHVPKPEALLPRRSSVRSVVPRREKRESSPGKKAILPSLPSIVVKHTPKSAADRSSTRLEFYGDRMKASSIVLVANAPQSNPTPAMKSGPRPFLLPPEAGAVPPSTSLSSIFSLPSQILKHTPLAAQFYRTPHAVLSCGSPCLSKARTKTVWTMVDEMKLIRTGGLLPDGHALAPSSQARVIPLCQRLRNGVGVMDSAQNDATERTPVRSVSTPYHLLTSTDRRSRAETTSVLPPIPSFSPALDHGRADWEDNAAKGRKGDNDGERYNWTLVDVKKPERRTTLTGPMQGGCGGVYVGAAGTKPSLLTRAQTLVKFKFSGSRKVVGRGDPKLL